MSVLPGEVNLSKASRSAILNVGYSDGILVGSTLIEGVDDGFGDPVGADDGRAEGDELGAAEMDGAWDTVGALVTRTL